MARGVGKDQATTDYAGHRFRSTASFAARASQSSGFRLRAISSNQQRIKSVRSKAMTGKVYLVGAGPGDPELLTLKAVKVLKSADVVLHDDLIAAEILAFIPSSTQVHNVGKRCGRKNISQTQINELLIQNALLGLQVVRLKSGDPLIFGRAGEEMEALRRANIAFEIVPGITAALGAAANAQIPLTHRQVSSALVLVTGHHAGIDGFADWPSNIPTDSTVVVYMPGHDYRTTAQQLLRVGVAGTIPCAIVSQATSPDEQVHLTTVEELHRSPQLPAPTLLVVGEVVRLAKPASLAQRFAWHVDAASFGLINLSVDDILPPAGQERAE